MKQIFKVFCLILMLAVVFPWPRVKTRVPQKKPVKQLTKRLRKSVIKWKARVTQSSKVLKMLVFTWTTPQLQPRSKRIFCKIRS